MAKKYYLDQEGTQRLVDFFKSQLGVKVNYEDLADYATLDDLQNVSVDLSDYASKDYVNDQLAGLEPYDDSEILSQLESLEAKTGGLYHFKGSIADLSELLAIENPEVGDTYNLADTGMNAAWTGSEWDQFGSVADLTEYLKQEEVNAISRDDLNAILFGGSSVVVSDAEGFKAVLANSEPEVEITLSENVVADAAIEIPAGKAVTMNLNGNKIDMGAQRLTVFGDLTVSDGAIEGTGRTLVIGSNGNLTVDGADIVSTRDCAISASGNGANVVVNSGSVTAQEVPVLVTSGASATINGGHLTGLDNFAIGGNGTAGQGDTHVIINGGVIEGKIQSAGYTAAAIYWPNSGTLDINGGTIISEGAGIVQRGGTVNLNSGTVVTANGPAGFVGKVGDSRVVVGSYAVVFDKNSKYPAMDSMALNIASDVVLTGTDGDIQVLPEDAEGIVDNR